MKAKEKQEAIKLRQELGLSLREIAEKLKISKGTASLWLRDIEISEEHKQRLAKRYPDKNNIIQINNNRFERCRKKRKENQAIGRKKIYEFDNVTKAMEFSFGCALYVAEGSKSKNSIVFTNTDPYLIKTFFDFVNTFFDTHDSYWKLSVNCYLNNGLTIDEIQNYWINLLGLDEINLRKATIKSKYYGEKKNIKYPYGVCRIKIDKTEMIQQLWGSIKELIHDDSDRWLD